MSAGHPARRGIRLVFLIATLAVAGGLSYLASPSPDGLDSATLRGCEITDSGGTEQLTGDCRARHVTEHAMRASPLADYTVAGADHTGGPAGVIGALVTLAVAGGVFRLIARSRPRRSARIGD